MHKIESTKIMSSMLEGHSLHQNFSLIPIDMAVTANADKMAAYPTNILNDISGEVERVSTDRFITPVRILACTSKQQNKILWCFMNYGYDLKH